MIRNGRTAMLVSPLVCKVYRHMIYQYIDIFHICLMIYGIKWYLKAQNWDRTLKKAHEKIYIKFFINDFSVNTASIPVSLLRNIIYNLLSQKSKF